MNELRSHIVNRSLLIFWLLGCAQLLHAQKINKTVVYHSNGNTLKESIEQIAQQAGVSPLYLGNLETDKPVVINCESCDLSVALTELLEPHGMRFVLVDDQLIIKEIKKISRPKIVNGRVIDRETNLPLHWATVHFPTSLRGSVCDADGQFSIPVLSEQSGDTLIISRIGYKKQSITLDEMMLNESQIYLERDDVIIPAFTIDGSSFISTTLGTKKRKAHSSIYLDSNGQKVAIEFTEANEGTISSASFFLTKEGNNLAPFRVRLYAKDSINQGPGRELLNDFLIAYPYGKDGWFEVDLDHYNLSYPSEGIFVAMEGITSMENEDLRMISSSNKKQDQLSLLSYGQRLGVRKSKKCRTWHYSLSNTWFQLPESKFDAMISLRLTKRKEVDNE